MTSYDIPRGNGKTLDDIILELEMLPTYDSRYIRLHREIIDDLKELRNAMDESK